MHQRLTHINAECARKEENTIRILGAERVKPARAEQLATKYQLITPCLGRVLCRSWLKALYE